MGNSAEADPVSSTPALEVPVRGLRPAHRAAHGLIRGFVAGGIFQTFIQRHHDVAPERQLNIHGGFGREQVRVAIQMRAEQDAFFGDFAQIAEAEHLEAARIGEDGARPGHEFVQPPSLRISSWPGRRNK
jgi:hypothetical protein